MQHPEIILFFFLIAFIYSSVGFGGGSSYIAILALYALPFNEVRVIALLCNIIVVTVGTILFIIHKEMPWKKALSLLCAGIIFAFLGARLKLSENVFYILLGISLIIAGILLLIEKQNLDPQNVTRPLIVRDSLLGGGVGFLAGMVGIGGGIFLSPLLNLMKWDTSRKIAATASIFILANSIAGIAGQLTYKSLTMNFQMIWMLGLAVLIGGQLGSRTGLFKLHQLAIKKITGILVIAAGIEILLKHLAVSS